MRFIATLFLCLALPTFVEARPSPYQPTDVFSGDRWLMVQGAGPQDMTRAMGCPPPCSRTAKPKAKKRKPAGHSHTIVRKAVPLPRVRPMDEHQTAAYVVIAEWLAGAKVYVKPLPRKPMNIFKGFAREIERAAAPVRGRSLVGIVKPLAAKVIQIASLCPGTKVISTIRPGAVVRGSGRPSLHRSGKAVDIAGPYRCIYAALKGFPGGVSMDAHRVRHVHISFDRGGREWGSRFAHWQPGKRRTRYARHLRRHYARAS